MSQELLSELARVKVLFQHRAIAAVLGVPSPPLPKCSCPPEVIARVQAGGTCAGGGCPYGGDF